MNWIKATNDQLVTIIKHDLNCPHSLLSGVVTEMLNRNLFDKLIADAIHKVINIKVVENLHKISMEDFMQNARMAIFQSIPNYQGNRGASFFTLAYMEAKHATVRLIKSLEAQKRNTRHVVSYQAEMNEDTDFEMMLEDKKTSIEKYVVNKLFLEQLLQKVNKHQRTVVYLYLQGYNFREIAELLGRGSFSTMSQAYNYAIRKMRKGA